MERLPGFVNPFKTKFSKMHSYAANQLLETIPINIENVRHWAILDSGATGNFLMTDAHTFSIIPTSNPISMTQPDGSKVHLTHRCILDLPGLPVATRNGHIIRELASKSLIAVVVLCNDGCEVMFTKFDVKAKYNSKIVLKRKTYARTELWLVPLPKKPPRRPRAAVWTQLPTYFSISNCANLPRN